MSSNTSLKIQKVHCILVTFRHIGHDVHSDHGYHSSYCSSNQSSTRNLGATHSHAWSLSSPDVSFDHEKSSHRAGTPDATTDHTDEGAYLLSIEWQLIICMKIFVFHPIILHTSLILNFSFIRVQQQI